jgi:surface carbohydrate biosynthesis protein
MSSIVYLTCEIKGRDFKSRLLIAAHLLKLGYHVVVGQQWSIGHNAPNALRGCVLFKTANRIQAEAMRHFKDLGYTIVGSDEEALSTSTALAAHTVDALAMETSDLFLALNDRHNGALATAFPAHARRIVTTGTARADLMRLSKQGRPHPRPYVLVNTSFGFTNSIWGNEADAVQAYLRGRNSDLSDPEQAAAVNLRLTYEHAALREIEILLPWLTAHSGMDVILRPHPNEKPERWSNIPGVTVVTASESIPWIKHAALMIHTDSTTGIEAAIIGAPALNLSPDDGWAQRLVVREVNRSVATAAEAIEIIKDRRVETSQKNTEFVPLYGARRAAQAIATTLSPPSKIDVFRWTAHPRPDFQKAKMSVTFDECVTAMKELFPTAAVPLKRFKEIDDSVFFFEP